MFTLFCALASAPVAVSDTDAAPPEVPPQVIVTADRAKSIDAAPVAPVTVTPAQLAVTTNVVNVEDAFKYLPSLIVRKRHVGDTQAVLATRTSGLGASARSLIYADGALLSALIGNNNSTASPRWSSVSPQEIARIDVLYGPFAAAYPGNSAGAVVNIATRMPDRFEGTATAGGSIARFRQYGTRDTVGAYQGGLTVGDRFGALSLFAAAERTVSDSQPLSYVTALRPAAPSAAGVATNGGYDDLNRTGAAIRVLGAGGIEHQVQDRLKLKAALAIAPGLTLRYTGTLFLNATDAAAESYLRGAASGDAVYAGTRNIGGYSYTIAPATLSAGVYRQRQRHLSQVFAADGSEGRLDWRVTGTVYDYAHDVQRAPTTTLPGANSGGAGTITRLDGTGWTTFDAKLGWRAADGAEVVSGGGHVDAFRLESDRYATADWRNGAAGDLNQRSAGRTRTRALWGQYAWRPAAAVTLTVGGRYEWWRAYDGVNLSLSPLIQQVQPARTAERFSPKATLSYAAGGGWTLRGSYGGATRFPTVGELYQVVTTPVAAVPNPDLKPERIQSYELAAEHRDARGELRLALFGEDVRDALISQAGPLNGGPVLATFVQNVPRTRARGIELSGTRDDLLARFDLSGSLTWADVTVRRDPALPAAEGKQLPGVPRWKATLVATWRPVERLSLTAAGRYASRIWGALDHSDVVGHTYQGFEGYTVADVRAAYRLTDRIRLGAGVDNVTDRRYFLFHPFPQRTFHLDVTAAL